MAKEVNILKLSMYTSLCAGLLLSMTAWATPANPEQQAVQLKNGFNLITMEGLRDNTFVTIAHLDNHDGHAYDMTTIYSDLQEPNEPWPTGLQLVPIKEKSGSETRNLFRERETKCVPEDYRVVYVKKDHETWLIVAKRADGKAQSETSPVTFTYYKLATASKRTMGTPSVEFKYWKELVSKQHYCSVEAAFKHELDLGEYRTDLGK